MLLESGTIGSVHDGRNGADGSLKTLDMGRREREEPCMWLWTGETAELNNLRKPQDVILRIPLPNSGHFPLLRYSSSPLHGRQLMTFSFVTHALRA